MHWIAASEKNTAVATLEKRLWDAADQFRANSGLKAQEYSGPILGLIFLRFAEVRFAGRRAELETVETSSRRGSRLDEPAAYHAAGVLYLAPETRFDHLLTLPESADIGAGINNAMRLIERDNETLRGVLPKTYNLFTSVLLKAVFLILPAVPAECLCSRRVSYPRDAAIRLQSLPSAELKRPTKQDDRRPPHIPPD